MNDASLQEMVREAAIQNSNESAKFMMVKDTEGNKTPVVARHWAKLPFTIYTSTPTIMKAMSYPIFMKLLRDKFPHIRRGAHLTDYCDHCATYTSVIIPTLGLECLNVKFFLWPVQGAFHMFVIMFFC